MRTEDLIVELARAHRPWTPLAPVRTRTARWIALSIALCGLTIVLVGPRRDLSTALGNPTYLALAVAMLAAGVVAAASALVLSVPGAERSARWRLLALACAGGWALGLVGLLVSGGDAWPRLAALPNHWACVAEIGGLTIVSGLVLFAMLRRAAPLRRGWSAALGTVAAASLAATATHLMCPIDDPAHHLLSHVLPVALLVAIGTAAGQRALKVRTSS